MPNDPTSSASREADLDAAPADGRIGARIAQHIEQHLRQPLAPGLYLIATPIGNLGDISLRALATLARADVIYCEDTRRSRPLLQHFGIAGDVRPYHDHNGERERPIIMARLARNERVALISDAGTPLISDPGFKLVREVVAAGHPAIAVPGASAVLAGLAVAGLPTDAFHFAGFLSPKTKARREQIKLLGTIPATLVLFEAANRLSATLSDLASVLGDRQAVVARELTKLHEETVRGSLSALAADRREWIGEAVLLVAQAEQHDPTDDDIRRALAVALVEHSVRDGARAVAEQLGAPRGRVYDIAVALKRADEGAS